MGLHSRSRRLQSDPVTEIAGCGMNHNLIGPSRAANRRQNGTTIQQIPRKSAICSTAC